MKRRTKSLVPAVLALFAALASQAQAPSSRKIPFNAVVTTMTCAPDPSPCQRNIILRMFDAATAGTQVGVDEPQTVSVDDSAGTGGSISFVLGSTRPMGVDPGDFQAGSSRFLDVLDATTSTSVLPGRIELTAVAFAVNPGPQGPQGIQGPQGAQGPTGVQGPPGVVQTVNAGDASIAVAGTAADRLVSVAPNGITNAHVANGALSPAKIAGNAATLGSSNNFTGNGSFAGGVGVGNVASFNIAAAPAGATESGTLVTITTTAPHSFNIGDLVTISGVAESGYNGTFYLAVPGSATTFTYVAPTAGLAASGGGTAASGALLSVNGSPNQVASPLLSITNSANAMASLSLATGGDTWNIGANQPPDNPTFRGMFFNFGTFGAALTKMAITPSGRVGIGTTIPSKMLDVFGDGNFNGSLSAGSLSTTGSVAAGSGSFTGILSAGSFTGGGAGLTSLNASNLSSGAVADVRLSSNVPLISNASNTFTGSLSIGANVTAANDIFVGNVTNPAFAGSHSIYFQNNGGDSRNSFRINAARFGSEDNLLLVSNSGLGSLIGAGIKFFTAPAGGGQGERMTIDPLGNVGIGAFGTAGPTAKLDVRGSMKVSGNVSAASVSPDSLVCNGCVVDNNLGVNYAGSASHGGPAANSLALGGVAPSGYAPAFGSPNYVAKSGDTMSGPLTVGANLTVNGNVSIGTVSPVRRLDVFGDASVSGTLSAGTLVGAGLSGMKEFTNDANIPSASSTWIAPVGVTHVMVELWQGGDGGSIAGGAGGVYGRGIVTVVPGTAYTIAVGGGGLGTIGGSPERGHPSSMNLGGVPLIRASFELFGATCGAAATICRGHDICIGLAACAAFGATFCPGPEAQNTGRGGDANSTGHAGYVLLTW